jgi:two-component system, OmpR family, phosphate regulon sensor histidine kinase PhoR
LKPRAFTKLFGLFALTLAFEWAMTALAFRIFVGDASAALRRAALGASLAGALAALPLAAWLAERVASRIKRVVRFAQRISGGDLEARLEMHSEDELAEIEDALNHTAERVGKGFREVENRRQELATILNTMQEAVVAITSDGIVRWANAVMQRMAGTQIHIGRPLVHSMRDPELLACVRGALERGEVTRGRASILFPGQVFEVNAVPLPGGGALAVLHDVTSIETAQKSRREFVANVSHELRTPLTSIQGYVETLLEDENPSPEMTREFLGIVLKNAARMNRLTEDLLALARVENPDNKLKMQPVKAGLLMRDALAALGGIVKDSGVKLQSGGAPNVTVMADLDALNQVFGNLIENSLKYGREGKRIRVGAKLVGSEVVFCVQDFGPGIASEHLDRIFERFYRVDKARSRESGGTGLGLAIVKHIVQSHGGRVWVESELGKGAAFHFTLPMLDEAQDEADEPLSADDDPLRAS